jgi:electron transfer flavoprotein beta subunit
MNIYVLMKQIPVISNIKINHQTFTVDRSSAGTMMNPADVNALAAAVDLKKHNGGTITVLSMGNESCDVQLREAAAMGADRLVRITDAAFSGADTLVTGKVLAAAIRQLGPADCIFCGQTALDGATGQIGAKLSKLLDIGRLNHASRIESGENGLTIHRKTGAGYEVWQAEFPLVCAVMEGSTEPVSITLKGKMAAKKAVITVLSNEDLKLDEKALQSPSRVEALFPTPRQEVGLKVDSTQKLADILFEKHLL